MKRRDFMAIEPLPLPEESDPNRPAIAPKGDRRLAIALLLAGVACLGMGQTIVFAVLPPLARRLGLADFQVAAIFMLSAMFWVALAPRWGRRSDQAGRKPFILTGLLGFAVSTALFATSIKLGLAGTLSGLGLYAVIVGTRSIYGIIGSATPAAAQGYIADRTPPARRTAGVSSFSAAFGLGAMVGPGLGGAVTAIGPLAPLYAVAALAALMSAVIFFLLPEMTPPAPRAPRPHLKLSDARLRPFLIFGLAFGVVNAAPIQTTAFYFMDVLHLSPGEAPQYAGIGLMAAAMASLFAQVVLVQRFGLQPHLLMRIAPALLAIGHALVAVSSQFGPLVFGLVIAGLGAGMALPGFTGAAMLAVGPDEQGAAAGLANSASASGFIFSPVVAFALYSLAPQAPYVLTATLSAALLVFALWSGKIRRAGRFGPDGLNP
ncbi:MAG: MFS transporter [Alphaproteobacteria bacterium]|nr:MFS transporter [Alphaproteobacteria bacterium]